MLNPVLETFLQLPYPPPALVPLAPGNSCLGCHQYATTAAVGIQQPPYAAGYSFMLGRASALPTDAP
jgi:hypothetical protein